MYEVIVDDYIRIVDSRDNEILHIELDATMDDVVDELNKLVETINRKLFKY